MTNSQIESVMFKKLADGYVYRAPGRWLWTSRNYLVNEAQKAEIVRILKVTEFNRPVLMGVLLGVFLVVVVMAWAFFGYRDREPGIVDYVLLLLMVCGSIFVLLQAFSWVQLYRLRPILAHLPRSNETVSMTELRAAVSKTRSLKDLILVGGTLAFVCAVSMFGVGLNLGFAIAKGHGDFNIYASSFTAILSGWVAFAQLRLAMGKAKLLENAG